MNAIHAAAGIGCVLLGMGPARADDGPNYSAFGVGKFLSYVNAPAPGSPIDAIPRLYVSFGSDEQHMVEMDTGSTGLVVSADQVPSLDGTPCDPCLTYSSSGKVFSGVWVTLPVTITGGNAQSITTAPIPVLAVTKVTCTDHPRDCHEDPAPTGIDIMGVGFAREYDNQPRGTPDANPFLNMQAPADAQVRRGYVVTRTGVHVGLTRKNTLGDFHFVKLASDDQVIAREWKPAGACISVAGSSPACGTLLVDTGVTSMFLTVPPQDVVGHLGKDGELADTTHIAFSFPDSQGAQAAAYGVTVGPGDDPLAPDKIYLNTTRQPFVNTSVRLLNGFDILYDADGGFFAFRARQ